MRFSRMTVIKLPKQKQFEYTPRHYDEAKERLEKRKKEIAQELGLNEDGERVKREINFRAKLSHNLEKSSTRKTAFWSNMRIFIILGILLIICYYIYINLDNVIAEITNK